MAKNSKGFPLNWLLAAAFCLAVCAAAILLTLLAGGAGEATTDSSEDDKKSEQTGADELATAPLPRLRARTQLSDELQREIDHVDPGLDGWLSETQNDQASLALKEIGEVVIAAIAKKQNAPTSIHLDARSTTLRPIDLETSFSDRSIKITRWNSTDRKLPMDQTFGEAIGNLFAKSTAPVSDFRSAFKITRVEGSRTRTEVQMSFVSDSTLVQHNAVWNCNWTAADGSEPIQLTEVQLEQVEEVHSELASKTIMTDCTEAVLAKNDSFEQQLALSVDHWRDTLDWRLGLDVAGPHGLAVGDADGDGLPDLFVCEPGGLPNRLYLQNADGTARDVSASSGIDWLEPATSALFLDLDNDGDQDLVFTSGRYFITCENKGRATFELQNVESMRGVARSITAADFDNDGLIDIYVCCYLERDNALDDVGLGMPMPYHDANNGPANILFKNQGGWKFANVTSSVGLDQNNRRFSYAAAWEDYDNDGDVDLYVANDFGRNNLYQNTNGTFRDVAAAAKVEDIATGMSVSWGDYNRDGHMDLYVGNMFSTAGNRVMYQRRFQSDKDDETRGQFRRLARGNSLFQNNGDGTFRDVSVEQSVTSGRWSWASLLLDLNNDGWEDILVANGMITSDEDPGDL